MDRNSLEPAAVWVGAPSPAYMAAAIVIRIACDARCLWPSFAGAHARLIEPLYQQIV